MENFIFGALFCPDYPESLHLCNIYFLDISFAVFFYI